MTTPTTQSKPDLSYDQQVVLVTTRQLGRSRETRYTNRYDAAREATGITVDAWHAAKLQCWRAGYLTRSGGLTVQGRDVCPDSSLCRLATWAAEHVA